MHCARFGFGKDLLTQIAMNGGGGDGGSGDDGRLCHQKSNAVQMHSMRLIAMFCFHYCCGYTFFIISLHVSVLLSGVGYCALLAAYCCANTHQCALHVWISTDLF